MSKDLIKILIPFFYSCDNAIRIEFSSVSLAHDQGLQIQKNEFLVNNKASKNTRKVIALDVCDKNIDVGKIIDLVPNSNIENLLGVLILCKNKIMYKKIFRNLRNYTVNGFGINPDYFFSIVPLQSSNRRNIEKYIFQLTRESTFIGTIKNISKMLLISLGSSNSLYDSFVLSLTPLES